MAAITSLCSLVTLAKRRKKSLLFLSVIFLHSFNINMRGKGQWEIFLFMCHFFCLFLWWSFYFMKAIKEAVTCYVCIPGISDL